MLKGHILRIIAAELKQIVALSARARNALGQGTKEGRDTTAVTILADTCRLLQRQRGGLKPPFTSLLIGGGSYPRPLQRCETGRIVAEAGS